MVASRDIKPGEVIFQDQACVVGPAESRPLCLDCNAKVRIIIQDSDIFEFEKV